MFSRFELLIFSFLKKLTDVTSQKELVGQFRDLISVIEKQSNEISVKDALKYFDFTSWLRSRVENKPFAELIKSKDMNINLPVT